MPIGNLTSQIFANIYLNELDRFVLHQVKPLGYVRYGGDFVLWLPDQKTADSARTITTTFLAKQLKISLNLQHDRVQPSRSKLRYLGVELWPSGKRLQPRVLKRIDCNLGRHNLASYHAILTHHQPNKYKKRFYWKLLDKSM